MVALAREALAQIAEKNYDAGPLPEEAAGRVRWGIASSGKRVATLVLAGDEVTITPTPNEASRRAASRLPIMTASP